MASVIWEHVLDDPDEKPRRIINGSGPCAAGIVLGRDGNGNAAGHLSVCNAPKAIDMPSYSSDGTIDAIAQIRVSEMLCDIAGQRS